MSRANALTRIGVLPFDWFGGGVVLADVGHQLAMEILGRDEDAAIDEVTFDFAEPKFDLVVCRRFDLGEGGAFLCGSECDFAMRRSEVRSVWVSGSAAAVMIGTTTVYQPISQTDH